MFIFKGFQKDESGAVTVDWVVLTAAIVGLGIATYTVVSGGVSDLSSDVDGQLEGQTISTSFGSSTAGGSVDWSGRTTQELIAAGQAVAPGNNGAVYGWATTWAAEEAPEGYNFDNPLHEPTLGHVVYTSDDSTSYAIGGDVYDVNDPNIAPTYFGA